MAGTPNSRPCRLGIVVATINFDPREGRGFEHALMPRVGLNRLQA
jgi:hypothetical protein